jgi:hypothetical protein
MCAPFQLKFVFLFVMFNLSLMLLEYVFRPMWLRPMWPMYETYIATLLGLALIVKYTFNMVSTA